VNSAACWVVERSSGVLVVEDMLSKLSDCRNSHSSLGDMRLFFMS